MANWNRLMEAADAAPSILNTKPWLFRSCDYDRIELYADWDQRLEVIDPRHRELFISCGAALFNVRIAIRVTGDDPLVSLAPDERNNGAAVCPHCGARSLLASVELGEPGRTHPVTLTEQALYEAIPRRHTVREPFTHRIQMSVLVALEEAARMEGVDARLLHRSETRRLRRLIAGVDKELSATHRTWLSSSTGRAMVALPGLRRAPRPIRAQAAVPAPTPGSGSGPRLARSTPGHAVREEPPADHAGNRGRLAVGLDAYRPSPAAAPADSDILPGGDILPHPVVRGEISEQYLPVRPSVVAMAQVHAYDHKDRQTITAGCIMLSPKQEAVLRSKRASQAIPMGAAHARAPAGGGGGTRDGGRDGGSEEGRSLPDLMDELLGSHIGAPLAFVGPASARVAEALPGQMGQSFLAGVFWWLFTHSAAYRDVANRLRASKKARPLVVCHADETRFDLLLFDPCHRRSPAAVQFNGGWSQPVEAIELRLSSGLSARRSSANTSAGVLN